MAIHLRGTLEPKEQSRTYKFDPTTGWSLSQTFRNFDEDLMQSLANEAEYAGVSYELTVARDVCTMTTQDTRGTSVIDTWQVAANFTSPNILQNPKVIAGVAAGSLKILGDFQKGNVYADLTAAETALGSDTYGKRIAADINEGQTSFSNASYLLRHTTNVSNRWDVNISDIGVSQLYSTAELLTEVTSQALWVYPLPNRLSYKILALASQLYTIWGEPANRSWSWLKQPSTESSAANNRVDIVTEYWFDLWKTDHYSQY